jgi:hypothetical protein
MLEINRKKGKTKLSVYGGKTVITLGENCPASILDIVDEVVNELGREEIPFHGSFSFSPDSIELISESGNKKSIRTYQHRT